MGVHRRVAVTPQLILTPFFEVSAVLRVNWQTAADDLLKYSTRQLLDKPEDGFTFYDLMDYFSKSVQVQAYVDLWLEKKSTAKCERRLCEHRLSDERHHSQDRKALQFCDGDERV